MYDVLMLWFPLYINRYICLRYPFRLGLISFDGYGCYIERAFEVPVAATLAAFQIPCRRLCYPSLLGAVDIFLWRCLDVHPAGLDLNKMYSIGSDRYDVEFLSRITCPMSSRSWQATSSPIFPRRLL